jgi:hypothetical protein
MSYKQRTFQCSQCPRLHTTFINGEPLCLAHAADRLNMLTRRFADA